MEEQTKPDPDEEMMVVEIPVSAWTVLPPAPGTCPECATRHDPRLPHNLQSLYYQVQFKVAHDDREPTWHDAMAHCTPETREMWTAALADEGVYINLKAYQINLSDTYAGRDLEEAIQAAIAETGVPREEIFDGDLECEADPETRVRMVEEREPVYTTIGEILRSMTKPGLVCSTEY